MFFQIINYVLIRYLRSGTSTLHTRTVRQHQSASETDQVRQSVEHIAHSCHLDSQANLFIGPVDSKSTITFIG